MLCNGDIHRLNVAVTHVLLLTIGLDAERLRRERLALSNKAGTSSDYLGCGVALLLLIVSPIVGLATIIAEIFEWFLRVHLS